MEIKTINRYKKNKNKPRKKLRAKCKTYTGTCICYKLILSHLKQNEKAGKKIQLNNHVYELDVQQFRS